MAYIAIDECLQLLNKCQIPVRTRLIIELNLVGIKRVMLQDPFNSKRCEFFVKQRFDALMASMRRLADEPGNSEIIPDVIADTSAILIFLGVAGT